jgi:hypothetical protein
MIEEIAREVKEALGVKTAVVRTDWETGELVIEMYDEGFTSDDVEELSKFLDVKSWSVELLDGDDILLIVVRAVRK